MVQALELPPGVFVNRALTWLVALALAGCAAPVPESHKHHDEHSLLGDPCELDSDCRDDALYCLYQICTQVKQ